MIVLVVGPSGVGKSASIKVAAEAFRDVIFWHLDRLAASMAVEQKLIKTECAQTLREYLGDTELFLAYGLRAIDRLAAAYPGTHLVIDVGAGFQAATSAIDLYRTYPVVTLTATQEAAYKRIRAHRNDARSFQKYIEDEFSEHRKTIYDNARETIDTTDTSLCETADRLSECLRRLFGQQDY